MSHLETLKVKTKMARMDDTSIIIQPIPKSDGPPMSRFMNSIVNDMDFIHEK